MAATDFLDKALVISLGRQGQRYRDFLAHNAKTELEFIYFEGVNGRELPPTAAVEEGIVTPGSLGALTPGAIGNAWTHRNIWRKVMATRKPTLVFEDDAILRHDIRKQLDAIVPRLPRDWELLLLGYNTDATLAFDVFPGSTFNGRFDLRFPSLQQLAVFAKQDRPVAAMKVQIAFGICAYLISPKGAETLTKGCFPLEHHKGPIIGNRLRMTVSTLDIKMLELYGGMGAYACIGPLALSPNDPSTSMTLRSAESA